MSRTPWTLRGLLRSATRLCSVDAGQSWPMTRGKENRGENGGLMVVQEYVMVVFQSEQDWLVVWNMNFIFPFSWECHHPN